MLSLESLLGQLVAIPSVSGDEKQIARFVAHFCRDRGHRVWMVNGSVAVWIRGAKSNRALIFNGHLDTVPTNSDGVLHMTVKNDRLIGLGVTDMKSGLAVMLMKAQLYQLHPPPCDVWLFFSREEETTAQGSLDLASWWVQDFGSRYAKKAVLILEPTGNAFVAYWHKGGGAFKATVKDGQTYHGATNLVNEQTVLDRVCRFGAGLKARQRAWLNRYPDQGYGVATINLTRLCSQGTRPNVVPAAVELWVDIRTNGALGIKELRQEFGKFRRSYGVNLSLDGREQDIVPAVCADPSSLRSAFAVGWPGLPERVFPAATDMNAFLWAGLPTGIVGPGNETIHRDGEYIEKGAMETSLANLLSVTKAFAVL